MGDHVSLVEDMQKKGLMPYKGLKTPQNHANPHFLRGLVILKDMVNANKKQIICCLKNIFLSIFNLFLSHEI